jgi:hypothetical protein
MESVDIEAIERQIVSEPPDKRKVDVGLVWVLCSFRREIVIALKADS